MKVRLLSPGKGKNNADGRGRGGYETCNKRPTCMATGAYPSFWSIKRLNVLHPFLNDTIVNRKQHVWVFLHSVKFAWHFLGTIFIAGWGKALRESGLCILPMIQVLVQPASSQLSTLSPRHYPLVYRVHQRRSGNWVTFWDYVAWWRWHEEAKGSTCWCSCCLLSEFFLFILHFFNVFLK